MSRSLARFRSLSLALALALIACSDDPDLQASLDDLVHDQVEQHDYLGLGISVRMADGRLLRSAAGVSDPNSHTPYSLSDTEQVIGSVTKLYTAVITMQLVEDGLLSLDDTLDAWFGFDGAEHITVRMLLQHTSGLGEYLNGMSADERASAWSPSELLERGLAAGSNGAPPLATAVYTNTDFTLLGLVIEAITHESWEANIAERIVTPLGLEHTYYAGETERAGHLSGGWIPNADGTWSDSLELLDPSIGWAVGAVVTTNDELMRFFEAFYDGELFDDPATLTHMLDFDVHLAEDNLGDQPPSIMGLGIMRIEVDGLRLDGHAGHIAGFNACAARDADTGAIIVVTSNDDRAFAGYPALAVAKHLHR